jgi:SAM-dependent methyltransferase
VRNRRHDLTRDGNAIPSPRHFFNRLWHALGLQLRHPSGTIGSLVGWFMAIANDEPNRLAIDALGLQPTDRVLELGFGPGWGLRTIAARVPDGQIFGVDQSDQMVRQATSMNEVAIAAGRVRLVKGPFSPLPWIDSTFNKILLVNVAYFFDSDGQDMAEVYRVLKSGGRIVIYVTSRETMLKWPFAGSETHRIYDRKELLDLLQGAGFRPSDIAIKDLQLPLRIKGLLATAVKSHCHFSSRLTPEPVIGPRVAQGRPG